MKTNRKKLLSLLLALVLCLGLCALPVQAAGDIPPNHYMTWNNSGNNPVYVEWDSDYWAFLLYYTDSSNYWLLNDADKDNPAIQRSIVYQNVGGKWTRMDGISSRINAYGYKRDDVRGGVPAYQLIGLQFYTQSGEVYNFNDGSQYGIKFDISTNGAPHTSKELFVIGRGFPDLSNQRAIPGEGAAQAAFGPNDLIGTWIGDYIGLASYTPQPRQLYAAIERCDANGNFSGTAQIKTTGGDNGWFNYEFTGKAGFADGSFHMQGIRITEQDDNLWEMIPFAARPRPR